MSTSPTLFASASHGWYERAACERKRLLQPEDPYEALPAAEEEAARTVLVGLLRTLGELGSVAEVRDAAELLGLGDVRSQPVRCGRAGREWGALAASRCLQAWVRQLVEDLDSGGGGRDAALVRAVLEAERMAADGMDEGWISPGRRESWVDALRTQMLEWERRLAALSGERQWGWLATSRYARSGGSGVLLRGEVAGHAWQRLSIVPETFGQVLSEVLTEAHWVPAPELQGLSWEEACARARPVGEIACALPVERGPRQLAAQLELAALVLA